MAVRIPGSPLSGATIDTDRGGMPQPRVDKSLAGALSDFGGSVQHMADGFMADQAKKDTFDDEAKFLLHREQTETAFTDAQRQMPADAKGFAQSFIAGRQQADSSFLASISPRNRERYALKWEVMRSNFAQKADATEYKARGEYEIGSINSALDVELRKLATDPNYKPQAVENLGTLLGNTSALDEATRADIKKKMAAKIDEIAVTGKYGGDPASLAKALGVTLPGAGRAALPETSVPGGRMAPDDVRTIMLNEVKRQGLVGMVPSDGARYGIKTGSAAEWANLFTGLAKHESGLDNRTVGDVGQFAGGSRGLLQLSYSDAQTYGFNAGKPFTPEQLADPAFNAAAGIAIAKSLIAKNGTIQGGMGKYWGPISKEGWVPGQGRDRGLPWQQWGAEVASGPTRAAADGAAAVTASSVPPGDPSYSSIPYDRRVQLVEEAMRRQKQAANDAKAEYKAFQTANKEQYRLGIANDDTSITTARINQDVISGKLDVGDAAALIETLKAHEKQSGLANQMLEAMSGAQPAAFNPFDPEVKKGADALLDRFVKAGTDPLKAVDQIQQGTGVVPEKAVSAFRGAIVGTNQQAATSALTISHNMLMRNPNVFAGDPGGNELAKQAIRYSHYTQDLGYAPQKALQMVQAADDPNMRAKVRVTDEDAKSFQKEIAWARSITSLVGANLDVSWWPGNPDIGQNDAVRSAMLNDFVEVAVQNLRDGMSKDEAKKMAAVQLGQIWGVTKLQGGALNGTVMKYAPEKRYAPAPDAKGEIGYGYFLEQARDFIKQEDGREVDPKDIRLMYVTDGRHGTLTTASAWDAKQPLPYLLAYSYKDETGQQRYAQMARPFVADPARAQKALVDKADVGNMGARRELDTANAARTAEDAAKKAGPAMVQPADIKGDYLPDEEKAARAGEINRQNAADYETQKRMKADKPADMSASGLSARQARLAEEQKAVEAELMSQQAADDASGAKSMDELVKASRGGVSMSPAALEKRQVELTEKEKAARRAVLKGRDK